MKEGFFAPIYDRVLGRSVCRRKTVMKRKRVNKGPKMSEGTNVIRLSELCYASTYPVNRKSFANRMFTVALTEKEAR